MDDIINKALHEFSFHLAKTEIEIFKERKRWRSDCALSNYFQSTPEKAVFSRVMYIAAVVKQGYTVGEMAKELSISRQTISYLSQFVNEQVVSKNVVAFGGNTELLNLQTEK